MNQDLYSNKKSFLEKKQLFEKFWHYNPLEVDTHGFTVRSIGRIVHDFSIDRHISNQNARETFWGDDSARQDIIYIYNIDHETPDLLRAVNLFRFDKIFSALVQIQHPGNIVTLHHDDFTSIKDKVIRLLIPIEDWQPGQSMCFGNTTLTCWRSGDIIFSDVEKIPHSTSNAGWVPRSLIQVTGIPSEYTTQLLAFNMGFVDLEGNPIKFTS
jgi:hypothetical protein